MDSISFLSFAGYQSLSHKTAIYPPVFVPGEDERVVGETIIPLGPLTTLRLAYPALGLAGEAGEFANKVKKIIRDKRGRIDEETKQKLIDELGDVLWYVSECATVLEEALENIAVKNINKLQARHNQNKIKGSGDNG